MPLLALLLLSACNPKTKWKSGVYKVHRFDSQQILSYDLGEGNSIGRVMHKVVGLGEDDTWIVVMRNPDGDVSVIEYYYFRKSADNKYRNADEIVRGPLSESEFKNAKVRLDLPEITERF